METLGDNEITNEVFLDDVWVHNDYVVGEVNKGWYYVSEALDFEEKECRAPPWLEPRDARLERQAQRIVRRGSVPFQG